jgi:UDP-N-acetylmuramoyl-L-alanyl-D-glutamate--2,6-diaminopimelate ligase
LQNLNNILSSIQPLSIIGQSDVQIEALQLDSRKVGAGDLFIAIQGTHADGHSYIQQVIAQGACTIVCEKIPAELDPKVCYIQVADASLAAGLMASAYYGNPSASLKLVGITGTNGKTTCATLLFNLFQKLGYTCGLISTIQNQINDTIIPATHTTPDAIDLQALLAQMKQAGCQYVFMEVSSHAVHQKRIAGATFTGACFTNITHDHLDYHHTFEEYIRVKKMFFDYLPSTAFALTNADDKRGLVMLQNTKAKKLTYSLQTLAEYKGKVLENNLTGLIMTINNQEVYLKMIGEFNAYNVLCVYGAACELGQDPQHVLTMLSMLTGAEGRFDYIVSEKEQILGIVDYAHTPDALLNVLATINKLRKGNETLFTIVGCGGDRDKTKRPVMALVACEHSNRVIFTSDNPRSENPTTILHEMEAGVPVHQHRKFVSIPDRREAIKMACSIAEQGDIVLVAGKGHEKYQDINGVKHPFDDKKILQEMFELFEK